MTDIKTFKNLYETTLTFNNLDEFKAYYEIHKNEIDKIPTRGLNIKYYIPGYRIGRSKGEMTFFKTDAPTKNKVLERLIESKTQSVEREIEKIDLKINKIQQDINLINENFNKLIECLKKIN